jgi:hypothetical protein
MLLWATAACQTTLNSHDSICSHVFPTSQKAQDISLTFIFSSLVCLAQCYIRTDTCGDELALSFPHF